MAHLFNRLQSTVTLPEEGWFLQDADNPTNGRLEYNSKIFPNYVLIDHGIDNQLKIRHICGTAGCFPPLENGLVAFQGGERLISLFNTPEPRCMSADLIITDYLKNILSDIGLIAIHCKENNFDLLFSGTSLSGIEAQHVKAIPVKEASTEFEKWKLNLIHNYKKVESTCRENCQSEAKECQDYAFQRFIAEFEQSSNLSYVTFLFFSRVLFHFHQIETSNIVDVQRKRLPNTSRHHGLA